MKKLSKDERKNNMRIMGGYLKRFQNIYIVLMGIISALEIFMIIRGASQWNFSKWFHYIYFISYWVLLIPSLILCGVLFFQRKKQSNLFKIGIMLHAYSALLMIWSVMVSVTDLLRGNTPIVYLTILVVVGGTFVIDPMFFLCEVILSLIALIGCSYIEPGYAVFKNSSTYGYHVNVIVFLIMALVVCFRNYRVNLNDTKVNERLKTLSCTDQLTGLSNESHFIQVANQFETEIKEKRARFGLILMDVNNVKNTNDIYGHRYGCHLIVTAGKTLPTIFKSSYMFHLGGDEFVILAQGEDLDNIDKLIAKLEKKLTYREIHYKERDIILSVAYGYEKYQDGMKFSEVLQKADDKMYKNKAEIKEKYHIKGR